MLDAIAFIADPRVLVIEDDPAVARTLTTFLERSGMKTCWARTAAEAIREKPRFKPEVALVDLGLPDASGVSLITWLAQARDCGIIVVSGVSAEAERVVGIELGADDYIIKPPSLRELVARIRAVHRRIAGRSEPAPAPAPAMDTPVRLGRATAWPKQQRIVDADGNPIHLTAAEFKTLELLLAAGGEPVTRTQICEAALRRRLGTEDRSVDQLILGIRRKLAAEQPGHPLISAVRGAGYVLHIADAAETCGRA